MKRKIANLEALTLFQWQVRLEQFNRENWDAPPRAAFRIDGTPFSTARHYGGFTMDGYHYTVFSFADGELLAVREDMVEWLKRKMRRAKDDAAKEAEIARLSEAHHHEQNSRVGDRVQIAAMKEEIARLEAALKPVMAVNMNMGANYSDMFFAVREAQRVMREGEKK